MNMYSFSSTIIIVSLFATKIAGMEQQKPEGTQDSNLISQLEQNALSQEKKNDNTRVIQKLLKKMHKKDVELATKKSLAHHCFQLAHKTYLVSTGPAEAMKSNDYSKYKSIIRSTLEFLDAVQEPGYNPLLIATVALDVDFALELLKKGASASFQHYPQALSAQTKVLILAEKDSDAIRENVDDAQNDSEGNSEDAIKFCNNTIISHISKAIAAYSLICLFDRVLDENDPEMQLMYDNVRQYYPQVIEYINQPLNQ